MSEDLYVDMSINSLADFVFIKNTTNKTVQLNINGIDNTRDLFCFCLDMLCKGLVMTFGQDNKVALNELTLEDFQVVQEKLKCIGIKCMLEVYPAEKIGDAIGLWQQNYLNVQSVRNSKENLRLEDYHYDIQTLENVFKIRFSLISYVDDTPFTHVL